MRFRHMLQNLPPSVIDELKTIGKDMKAGGSGDVPAQALETWAQWRNWDVPNVQQSVAFQHLIKEEENAAKQTPRRPLALTVRSEYLRISVDSSGESNEIVIEETSVGVESTPPTAPTGLMLFDENTRTKSILQAHTSSIALSFNWSIFGIVELVLPLREKLQELSVRPTTAEQPSA